MKKGDKLEVNGHTLIFMGHPTNRVAHPETDSEDASDEECTQCAIAQRTDTGEPILLWKVHDMYWSVSREDPKYKRHKEELS